MQLFNNLNWLLRAFHISHEFDMLINVSDMRPDHWTSFSILIYCVNSNCGLKNTWMNWIKNADSWQRACGFMFAHLSSVDLWLFFFVLIFYWSCFVVLAPSDCLLWVVMPGQCEIYRWSTTPCEIESLRSLHWCYFNPIWKGKRKYQQMHIYFTWKYW